MVTVPDSPKFVESAILYCLYPSMPVQPRTMQHFPVAVELHLL